jgi:hypothetical protein
MRWHHATGNAAFEQGKGDDMVVALLDGARDRGEHGAAKALWSGRIRKARH